jgi:hypothetical protein
MLIALTGCAHQREAFFPPSGGGTARANPKTNVAAGRSRSKEPGLSVKPKRVPQSASRAPGFDDNEPFDFDQALRD